MTLADAEDLPGHGDAVRIRLERHDRSGRPGLPLRPELVGHRAVRRTAARRAGAASTSTRTPTRPRPRSWPRSRTPSPRPRRRSTAIPTARPPGCVRRLAAYLGHGLERRPGLGRQRLQRGHAARPAGVRRARSARRCRSRRRTRCIRSTPATPRPAGSPVGATTTSASSSTTRSALIEQERPDVVLLASPNNPTGHGARPRHDQGDLRGGARRRRGRRGVRGVPPRRHAVGPDPARRLPDARRHPDDVEGVRPRRRAGRLPRGERGVRRRPARRAAALPPVRRDPGGRDGRPAACRRAARPGGRPACRARRHRLVAARPRASTSRSRTRTSCCSAGSPTGTRSGRASSTMAC